MDAVTPHVIPGVTMTILVEEVEHQLRMPRLALPLVSHAHLHLGRAPARLGRRDEARSAAGGRGRPLRLRRGRRRATAPTSGARSPAASRRPATTKRRRTMLAAQEAGRAARVWSARARGERRLPRADRGSRPGRGLPPPDGPRDRARRARAAVPLGRGRHAARGGHDLHRRAVDPRRRQLRRPRRGRDRGRAGGGRLL